jgi:F-type H+-transporting ATPase subunit b
MMWLIALAAAGEGAEEAHEAGVPVQELAVSGVSLLLFLVILFLVARKPVGDALANRALEIRKAIDEAVSAKQAAEKRFAEVESKLASLDQQLASMNAQAEREAEAEAARLVEKANADAARIQEVAERTIREESDRARRGLREEAVKLAVGLARQKAAQVMTVDDQRRFAREFLDTVKEAQ